MENTKLRASQKYKKRSTFDSIWRQLRKNKGAIVGMILLVVIIIIALVSPYIFNYETDVIANNVKERMQHPSSEHWFGTDTYGRDVFARVIHGSRVSLSIGVVTSLITLVVGGMLGAVAGYYGGAVDNIIMRIMDTFMCIPFMLLALAIVASLGPSMTNLLIAITISNIPSTTRLVRSCILTVVDQDYVEAAKSYCANDLRIIVKYILPNAMGPIIVNTTMGMASMILAAAGLSFIGMGIQPPDPEWGSMLSSARDFMRTSPYLLYIPGIAIVLSVLSINLVGDGLRDALDPKLKD